MSYIELQESARRNTRRLVLLLSGVFAAVVLELFLILRAGSGEAGPTLGDDVSLLVTIAGWTLLFTGLAALYKTYRLRDGGPAVAKMLGGRAIQTDTRDPAERTPRNVVEEMAIASALPVPAVYVLDHEEGMNAFAAGLTPQDAAVAVTRGTLYGLTRDELQGGEFLADASAVEFTRNPDGLVSALRKIGVSASSLPPPSPGSASPPP